MDDEPSLEVTDRRRVGADAETAGASTDGPTSDILEPARDEADSSDTPLAPAMDVYSLLSTTIALLANGAWGWMGLTPNPFTGEMEKDLAQARVAIDTVAFLADRVEPRLSEPDQREMRNLLSNLRVNFVQQSQMPSGKEESK